METKFDKTVEILFELKVSDVMRKELISIGPDALMSDLKDLLKKHRISGVPVIENDTLVGIVSTEDLISWLGKGENSCAIRDMMTRDPQCLYADQPLVHAVRKFDQFGFGRFPVIDRESGKLLGIITKGAIIEGTLRQLEKEYKEEEIRQYRASHFFQDLLADDINISLFFNITGKDFDKAGKASTTMKKNLKRLGIRPDIVQRVSIASYEAEINVVLYADHGSITYEIEKDKIVILVNDSGPGIENLELAMEPGFSTAESWVRDLGFGAGMGLPNMKKCSDTMDIHSDVGVGTTIKMEMIIGSQNADR
jgi:CBS domain-containing protein/anti-sigma regulatory factor (Ser/Thr protein kinase)